MYARRSPALLIVALALVLWRAGVFTHSSGTVAGGSTYVGTTSQGLPISFTASSSQVSDITFAWTAHCADGQTHTNSIEIGGASIASGAFSSSGTLNTGGQASVSGQISGANASGRLSRSGPTAFGTDCTDNGVTWTARSTG